MCKLVGNTKVDENLTTNVLIFIYFCFFLSPRIIFHYYVVDFVWIKQKQEHGSERGGVPAVAQGLTHLG